MGMNAKQKKLLEWFDKLERFARNENLPLRLMDSIGDLKEQAAGETTDWYRLYPQIEDLLHSIDQKVQKDLPEDIIANDERVSADEVRQQITETIERSHQENLSSVHIAVHGNHAAVKECYRRMKEITSDKKALKKIGNGNYFLQFFQNVRQHYEQNANRNFNDFAESVSNNCTHMIERIKSMCKNIDGYKLGLGEQEFYIKYSETKKGWDVQLLHRIESTDLGSNAIMDFAQESLGKIQGIIRNYQKKRNLRIFLPLLIMLLCSLLAGGFFLAGKHMDSQNGQDVQTNTENAETNSTNIFPVPANTGVLDQVIEAGRLSIIQSVLIAIAVILIIYIAYIVFLLILFHHKILSACGECLQKECALFEKENRLDIHSELEEILTEYEKHYLDIINDIFSGTTLDSIAKDGYEYKQLLQEWNTIQRMREGA